MSKKKSNKLTFKELLDELLNKPADKPRDINTLPERKYFLIVCEGERTEPEYFQYFKSFLPRNLIETINISGEGDNTVNVVNKAIAQRNERDANPLLPNFDEVWAVYDKDDFPAKNYNDASKLAAKNNINAGDSNQSFELWYVLHFNYLDSAINRQQYIKILDKALGYKYAKNDPKVVKHLFEKCNINSAISRAKKLNKLHEGKTPSQSHPSTNVYKLVEKLLVYCQK